MAVVSVWVTTSSFPDVWSDPENSPECRFEAQGRRYGQLKYLLSFEWADPDYLTGCCQFELDPDYLTGCRQGATRAAGFSLTPSSSSWGLTWRALYPDLPLRGNSSPGNKEMSSSVIFGSAGTQLSLINWNWSFTRASRRDGFFYSWKVEPRQCLGFSNCCLISWMASL